MLISDDDFAKLPKLFPIVDGESLFLGFEATSYCGVCGSSEIEIRGVSNDASMAGHRIIAAKGLARCPTCKTATEISFRIDFTLSQAKMRVGDSGWHTINMSDCRKPSWRVRLKDFVTNLFFGKKSH